MNSKQLLIGVLVTFLTFGLFGTAFAASDLGSPQSSEAGVYQFNFNAPLTMADKAAMNHEYDRDSLARVGSEQGSWQYRVDAPKTDADIAAMNHEYDQKALSEVGTERGIDNQGVLCSSC